MDLNTHLINCGSTGIHIIENKCLDNAVRKDAEEKIKVARKSDPVYILLG